MVRYIVKAGLFERQVSHGQEKRGPGHGPSAGLELEDALEQLTYLHCDASADARDEDDAPPIPEAFHLASCGLRGEQNTIHVYV